MNGMCNLEEVAHWLEMQFEVARQGTLAQNIALQFTDEEDPEDQTWEIEDNNVVAYSRKRLREEDAEECSQFALTFLKRKRLMFED